MREWRGGREESEGMERREESEGMERSASICECVGERERERERERGGREGGDDYMNVKYYISTYPSSNGTKTETPQISSKPATSPVLVRGPRCVQASAGR